MTLVSHAQNFEDVLLWRALGHIENGRYVDIGAQDPVVDSVSLAFYERGWRGVHVEPSAEYAALLRQSRPEETVIEAVVGEQAGLVTFFEIPGTGISTGQAEIAEFHAKNGWKPRKISVPSVRLEEVFAEIDGEIHWLKIDVEGMEREVLESWRASERRPWVVLVEATYPTSQIRTEQAWIDQLSDRGYEAVFFDGISQYFVHRARKEIAGKFNASINIFDDFVVAPHHFSAIRLRERIDGLDKALRRSADMADGLETQLAEAEQRRLRSEAARATALDQLVGAQQTHAALQETFKRERAEAEQRQSKIQEDLRTALDRASGAEAQNREISIKLAHQTEQLRNTEFRLEESLAERTLARQQWADHQAMARQALEELEHRRASLADELQQLTIRSTRLHALVQSAVADRPSRWQRLGRALGLARPSESWQALSNWSRSIEGWSLAGDKFHSDPQENWTMPSHSSVENAAPARRAESLAELLSLHDVQFVRSAYVTLLGREPDPEGEKFYLDRLRRGYSQLHILRQFRTSREATNHDPGIAGLDRALKRAARERWPVLGAVIRVLSGNHWESPANQVARALVEGSARLDRRLLVLEDQVGRLATITNSLAVAAPAAPARPYPESSAPPSPVPVRVAPIIAVAEQVRTQWLAG